MASTLDDIFARRTRARLFDRDATVAAADCVAALVGPELGWTAEQKIAETEAYRSSCAHEAAAGRASVAANGTT